jgi:heme/copper-type cytochrome/quinol oxidase subunit 2
MQMKVVVESEAQYNAWLEAQEEFLADKPSTVNPDARAEVATNENDESATL